MTEEMDPDTLTTAAAIGGAILTRLLARRGWSSGDLEDATGGEVSASSVRSYTRHEAVPSPRKARAIALALDDLGEGVELLQGWDLDELAEGLEAEARRHPRPSQIIAELADEAPPVHLISYRGRELRASELRLVVALIDRLQRGVD